MTSTPFQSGITNSRELDLERAFSRGEIQAYFQPKVDLRDGRVVGVEALARWVHPSSGLIDAKDFLPLVEAGSYMRALTERVLEFSTRAAGDWWRSGLGLQLSVNLSLEAISGSSWDLPAIVDRALSDSGLPGDALQFEVTESGLLVEADLATRALEQLRELGATIAVDDFGTGHFSLRQLMDLPIQELKIDRSFIHGPTSGEKTIVRSIIHLAHQMGLQVVAEGVETEETWRQLRRMGAERAQGFLISKPIAAREVPAWLATWNQRARELSSTKRVRRRSGRSTSGAAEPAPAT